MIQLENLTKTYDKIVALEDLTLEIQRGELLVLLGGSGCGKTTTLKIINRLVEPTSGIVRIDGTDTRELLAHELRRRIGYCFQGIGLFPHMTVAENVAITLDLLGWEIGERQARVHLGRALAAKPGILLLDEPFGALDPLTRDRLQRSFQDIRKRLGLTGVFVTHDMVEALLLGDRVAVLDRGRLVQLAPPRDLLLKPANDYVAQLMDTPRRQTERLEGLLGGPGTTPGNEQ
jgi:osmoprotectant transport system ATP-binding protein